MNETVNRLVEVILDAIRTDNADDKMTLLDAVVDKCIEENLGAEMIVALERSLVVESILLDHTENSLETAERFILKNK